MVLEDNSLLINIYRNIKIIDGEIKIDNICKCPCTNNCEKHEFSDILQQYTRTHSPEISSLKNQSCKICARIVDNLKTMLSESNFKIPVSDGKEDVNKYFLDINVNSVSCSGKDYLLFFYNYYKNNYNNFKQILKTKLTNIESIDNKIENNRKTILNLRERLVNRQNILIEQSKQVQSLTSNLISKNAQANLKQQDTVTIGLPYLPFFKMTNRNYILMMFIINILLLVGIIVYSFRKSIKTQYLNTKNENKMNSLDNTEIDENEEEQAQFEEEQAQDETEAEAQGEEEEEDFDNRLSD